MVSDRDNEASPFINNSDIAVTSAANQVKNAACQSNIYCKGIKQYILTGYDQKKFQTEH